MPTEPTASPEPLAAAGAAPAVVDSHCHASLAWFQGVESLVHEMDQHGVARAILIQIRGQYDNSYQADCRRRFPGRFASVVGIDWEQPDAPARLARLADEGASGVRLRPWSRSPGADPLAIWRAAERGRLPVSCLGTAEEFGAPDFARLVESLPGLTIVLEHLAGIGSATAEPDTAALDRLLALAHFPTLYVKIPGLGEFCQRAMPVSEPFPFVQPIPPLLPRFYEAFGPQRLMWGSDYPPVAGREGYRNALSLALAQFAAYPPAARRAIFGETALSVFPVRS
jgi:L-fuconolactonase